MMKLSKKKTSKKHDVTHYSIGNWRAKLGLKYYGNEPRDEAIEVETENIEVEFRTSEGKILKVKGFLTKRNEKR